MKRKHGIALSPLDRARLIEAVRRGDSRKDVMKRFGIGHTTYRRYAHHLPTVGPENKKIAPAPAPAEPSVRPVRVIARYKGGFIAAIDTENHSPYSLLIDLVQAMMRGAE